ncbi:hypothetical protein BH23PLA1_BH23PLA1_40680 [soil metagenome]
MTPLLTPEAYAQTKTKLAALEHRLAELETRTDLQPQHHAEVRRSYERMMRQYRREIKLFEATLASQKRATYKT